MEFRPLPITKDLIAQHDLTDYELTEEQEAGILAGCGAAAERVSRVHDAYALSRANSCRTSYAAYVAEHVPPAVKQVS